MKLQNIFLTLLILFVFSQAYFGQEKPKAELIDEFGNITCEELLARLDGFFTELQNNADSTGYVVIYGKNGDLMKNLRFESWIIGHTNFRNFPTDRLIVIRGQEQESFNIKFWKVSAETEKPEFPETKWSYALPKSTKPFIFTAYTYGDGICPSTSYIKLYADFLIANSKARGHLVIRDKTSKNFRIEEKKVLDELVIQYKVPRKRLKIFYVKDKEYPYDYTDVEFWLIP